MREIIVDNFAGGGGASTGIEIATGRSVDIAINHDPEAIRMHMANHPDTKHYCESVWDVDPVQACAGRPVGLAWFSPDCKHFSKAKGGKPKDKNIRGLAWVALRWAGKVRPRVIMLENVEEFQDWGPLNRSHRPIKNKKGCTYHKFVRQLEALGYKVETKELIAADYGAPTKRKRFFLVARCDREPIIWPDPTHGPRNSEAVRSGKLLPYVPAAEIIDWSIPCPSIFGRKKPLAENTMKRIARGLKKFVIDNPEPFIVPIGYGERKGQLPRVHDIKEPMPTAVGNGKHYLVKPVCTPYISQIGQAGFTQDRNKPVTEPITTVVSKNEHCLVEPLLAPYIEKAYGGNYSGPGSSLEEPLHTVTTVDHNHIVAPTLIQYHSETAHSEVRGQDLADPIMTLDASNRYGLVSAFICQQQGQSIGTDIREPLNTMTGVNHMGEVIAFLTKYYGCGTGQDINEPLDTITSKDRFGLVEVRGAKYQIVDIGLRMLEPHELYAAQGFPADYIIDRDIDGKSITKTEQVKRCGNAVCPPIPAALVKANLPELCTGKRVPICRNDRLEQEKTGKLRFA